MTERIRRTADLRAAGYDKNAVRRLVRAGTLIRLCRGAYIVGWLGVPDARRVVAFADARSESVGESRSRVAIALAGLPPPQLQ